MKKRHVELTPADQEQLEHLLAGGISKVRVIKRATGLFELNRGKTLGAAAATLGVSGATIAQWRNTYKEKGLRCLEDAPRSGRPIEIDGGQRAKITALACSQAPEGHAPGGPCACWPTRWSSWATARPFPTRRWPPF